MFRLRPTLTTLEAREVPAATLQVIHNAPYPSAAAVDVYVNNTLPAPLTGLAFRSATPFLDVPSDAPVVVSVRPAGASAATAPLFTQTFTFADGSSNQAVALGDPTQPGTAVTKFQLLAGTTARRQATIAGNAEFVVVHGSPDAPPVDVKVRGVGTVVDDISYPSFATDGYLSVAPAKYTVDVTLADGVSRVGSFAADLSGAGGKAITVLASGFVGTPPAGAEANRFGLLAVNADGTTALLPAASPPPLGTGFAVGAANNAIGTFAFDGQVTLPVQSGQGFGRSQERVALADVNGDGVPDRIVATGPGNKTSVRVDFLPNPATGFGGSSAAFQPFEDGFTGGVFVAAADLTGDGQAEVIVTPDQGGGPVVAIYDGAKLAAGLPLSAQLVRFFGIEDAAFRGGARAAAGDLNADGTPDVVVAAGFGGGPRVAVFDGTRVLAPVAAPAVPPKLVPDFFVFENTLRNGAFVTAGDLTGDGAADLIVGGGPGGGPRVFALDGRDLTAVASKQTPVANFFAGDLNNRDGVRLAAKDLDGDRLADLVVGLGSAGVPQVRGFRGSDFAASVSQNATPPAIAALDLNPFASPGVVYVG